MTRNMLRWLARGLIVTLLSMQLVMAAHACMVGLSLPLGAVADMSSPLVADLPQVDQPAPLEVASSGAQPCLDAVDDDASTNLCNEHCKRGQQSDKAASLVVPMVLLTARYSLAPPLDIAPLRRRAVDAQNALVASQPPHAIAHCVLRT